MAEWAGVRILSVDPRGAVLWIVENSSLFATSMNVAGQPNSEATISSAAGTDKGSL